MLRRRSWEPTRFLLGRLDAVVLGRVLFHLSGYRLILVREILRHPPHRRESGARDHFSYHPIRTPFVTLNASGGQNARFESR